MVTLTMKQAETFKALLTKANKGTHWLDKKMEKASKVTVAAAPKKVVKKKVAKAAKKVVAKKATKGKK